jgi:hypothetical protein
MIDHDRNVGDILDHPDKLGIADNTYRSRSLRVPKLFNLRTDPSWPSS